MTIAFDDSTDKERFVIKVGSNYFIKFSGKRPQLTAAKVLATTFNYYEAVGILLQLDKIDYKGEIVTEQ